MDPKHLHHQLMVGRTTAYEKRMQSRQPSKPAARKQLNELYKLSMSAAQRTDFNWDTKYSEDQQSYASSSQGPVSGSLGIGCPDLLG